MIQRAAPGKQTKLKPYFIMPPALINQDKKSSMLSDLPPHPPFSPRFRPPLASSPRPWPQRWESFVPSGGKQNVAQWYAFTLGHSCSHGRLFGPNIGKVLCTKRWQTKYSSPLRDHVLSFLLARRLFGEERAGGWGKGRGEEGRGGGANGLHIL